LLLPVLVLAALARADDFGRTLRGLKADDRERRREALDAFAAARIRPDSRSERRQAERALARFLSARFPGSERALAVQGLGRLSEPPYDRLLKWLPEERDDRVLAAAEEVFRAAPGKFGFELASRLAETRDPVPRAILIRMLGAIPDADARRRTRLHASIADHWCPRAAAAHALARDRDPAALPPLVALLDSDDPALLTAAAESLTLLTRQPFGRDAVKWKAWWDTRAEDAPLLEVPREPLREGERRYAHEDRARRTVAPRYFGIPIRGRKVVFVFDVSASMRYKLPLATDQLVRAVKGLPSDSEFEVIFFNEHVWPWRGRLSHADPVTKELLVRHLPTIEIKSYTNLFDSVAEALDLGPEEVFVISDGAPNRGRWRLPRDIIREVKARNETVGATIHTVSVVRVVDGDEHIALLKAIAEGNGGEHVQRTLK
jgi:hypothetical protein